jgi:hypothetical protein
MYWPPDEFHLETSYARLQPALTQRSCQIRTQPTRQLLDQLPGGVFLPGAAGTRAEWRIREKSSIRNPSPFEGFHGPCIVCKDTGHRLKFRIIARIHKTYGQKLKAIRLIRFAIQVGAAWIRGHQKWLDPITRAMLCRDGQGPIESLDSMPPRTDAHGNSKCCKRNMTTHRPRF